MMRVLVLRSSANPTLFKDLSEAYPRIDWVDVTMPFLPGRGESDAERERLGQTLKSLIAPYKYWDMIFYARAYGAFSAAGRHALEQTVNGPIITAPGAVLRYWAEKHWSSLFIVTPYGQARHDFEVQWASSQGMTITASSCLGYDDGEDIAQLTAQDLMPGIVLGDHSPAQGIYLACTITRTIPLGPALRSYTAKPVISATDAMLWVLQKYVDGE